MKRTPCIGICSTTYGDLVCRGCKRFAHEIVQWNGFEPAQRDVVWQRLRQLQAGAVRAVVAIRDPAALLEQAARHGLATDGDPASVLYELLRRAQWRAPDASLGRFGAALLEPGSDTAASGLAPSEVLARIDREFYHRSLAHYERNFRIPAE